MNDDDRRERRAQIEAAALALLAEVGYRKTSMLQIAKRAQASNQTLYAWYENKQGLFRAIIRDNGQRVREQLEAALNPDSDPHEALEQLGPTLLRFTSDEKAIIMNRAAVTDAADTGVLAQAIDEVGRDSIYPLIRALMGRLIDSGVFEPATDADEAAQVYVALLFGEAQLRQALGTQPPFDARTIRQRASRTVALLYRLFGQRHREPDR